MDNKKSGNLFGPKNHATSLAKKKIMQSFGTKKNHGKLSGQKKIMQMAPNYSKWFQMTMAKANSYGNGQKLSQIVANGPKWSKDLGLRTKD